MGTLTAARARELFDYDMETGVITRRVGKKGVRIGDVAGTKENSGYTTIMVDRRRYRAHRLAWLLVYGQWPRGDIDHIDGCKSNNTFKNLRIATQSVNQSNRPKPKTSTSSSACLGVHFDKGTKKFRAQIKTNRIKTQLGLYELESMAGRAYIEAKRRLHPSCPESTLLALENTVDQVEATEMSGAN